MVCLRGKDHPGGPHHKHQAAAGPRVGEGASEQKQAELEAVSKALADLEGQFLQHLDLLKRGVLSEAEFTKANEVAKSQSTAL